MQLKNAIFFFVEEYDRRGQVGSGFAVSNLVLTSVNNFKVANPVRTL